MKKSITLLLSLALSFAAFGTLTACEQDPPPHTHSYVDGSCSCGEKDPNAKPENPDPENPTPGTTTTTVTEAEWNASFNLGTNFTIVAQQTDGTMTEKYVDKRAGSLYESTYATYVNDALDGHETHNFYEEKDGVTFYYLPSFSEDTLLYYEVKTINETLDERVVEVLGDYIPDEFRAMSSYTYNETTKKYEMASATVGQVTVTNLSVGFENKKISSVSYTIAYSSVSLNTTTVFTYGDASITLPTNVQGSLAPGYDQPATGDALAAITETQFAQAFDFGTNYSATVDLEYPANIDEEDEHYYAKRNGYLFESGGNGYVSFYEYDSYQDVIYAYHQPQTDGGAWSKVVEDDDFYELENMILMEFLNPAFMMKSNFTYNATKNAWTAETIEISMGDSTAAYTNVEIYFNKLLKASTMEYDFTFGSMSAHFTLAIEYGKTTVTLPTNVQGGQGIGGGGVSKPDYSDYQIKDDYYWALALSGEDAGPYECDMFGYEDGAITNHMTMGVTDTVIYMESFNSTGASLGTQYFEKVEENGTVSYYIYGYDMQLEVWHKADGNESIFNSVNMTQFTVYFLDYEAFTFNEELLAYVQTGEIITVHNETITNAELKFENGKLVSLTFTITYEDSGRQETVTQNTVITFNYDETLNYFDQLPTDYEDLTQTQGNN